MHEPEMTAYLLSKFTPDAVFLDIGAHVGYYTFLAAPMVKKVIAFEPQRRPRNFIRRGVEQGRYTNVVVHDFPLFSKIVRGTMNPKGMFRPLVTGELYSITLDSMNLVPDIIKIDAEGSELDILIGAEKTLRLYRPILGVEIHWRRLTKFGRTNKEVIKFLKDMGYEVMPLRSDWGQVAAEWHENH